MPIVVNGTTIPENVANALNVNGTNITSVVCDGVTVWTQSLIVREPASGEYYDSATYCFTLNNTILLLRWGVLLNTEFTVVQGATSFSYNGYTYYRGSFKRGGFGIYEYGIYRISN